MAKSFRLRLPISDLQIDATKENIFVEKDHRVKSGQKLGLVGKLNGMNKTMLHLELYAKHLDNSIELTDPVGCSPYKRRSDLIDPTPSINAAVFEPLLEEAPAAAKSPAKP